MFNLIKQSRIRIEERLSQSDFKQGFNPERPSRKSGWSLAALAFLTVVMSWQSAEAQIFDVASTENLDSICKFGAPDASVGPELANICIAIGNNLGGQPASAGVGTQSQPNSILIAQQQLKDQQTKKEREEIKPGSADAFVTRWGDKFSTFLTAGATSLTHRQNDFEQGYNATIPSVTLGGGYNISDALMTGLAFNYSNSHADFNTGGGFNVDSYTPLFYINYLPFDNAFANLVLGYTRQNQTNNRIAVASKRPNCAANGNPDGCRDDISFRLNTTGNVNANQYDLSFLSGYDHPLENFTIGPRLGVDVRQWEIDGYRESTNTGLELSYNSQHQTSIQSTLGLAASFAHSTPYGDLVPQFGASWVHEYSNNSRIINSKFIQAPTSNGFSFQTETPARNWAVINLGVSLWVQKGLQTFVNFSTVQGNRNFETYGGNVGVAVDW